MGETGEDGLSYMRTKILISPVARWSTIRSTGRGGTRFARTSGSCATSNVA